MYQIEFFCQIFKTKFKLVSLRIHIHPNVQTKVKFKISRIRNRLFVTMSFPTGKIWLNLIDSKFQEFETVRTLKIQKTTKVNDYEKPAKKEERKKKEIFQSPFLLFLFFVLFVFITHNHLHKNKDKKYEKKKKREGVLEGFLPFSFLLFYWLFIIIDFDRFFVFWEFERFRILEILNLSNLIKFFQ